MMQLTQNHVQSIMRTWDATAHLACYLQEENTKDPKVIITAISPGSSADELLSTGMILQSINDQPVSTLQELRENFVPPGSTWKLVTDKGNLFVADFKEELVNSVNLTRKGWAPLSPAVTSAIKEYYPGLIHSPSTDQGN